MKIANAPNYIDSFYGDILFEGISFIVAGKNIKNKTPCIIYCSTNSNFRDKFIVENALFTRDESFEMIFKLEFDYATKMNAEISKDYWTFKAMVY